VGISLSINPDFVVEVSIQIIEAVSNSTLISLNLSIQINNKTLGINQILDTSQILKINQVNLTAKSNYPIGNLWQ